MQFLIASASICLLAESGVILFIICRVKGYDTLENAIPSTLILWQLRSYANILTEAMPNNIDFAAVMVTHWRIPLLDS